MMAQNLTAALAQQNKPQWRAELLLSCKKLAQGTRLVGTRHYGPLYIQKPFYPEGPDCMHLYPLHPPGGVVSGDSLHLRLDASASAELLLTTPGALRFYKARETDPTGKATQVVSNLFSIAEHSTVEYLPMETIVFNGAQARNETRVYLDDTSQFIGWDIVCLGLPARAEFFTRGLFLQSLEIYRAQRPLFIDRLRCDANNGVVTSRAGLAGLTVYGTLLCVPSCRFDSSLQAIDQHLTELRSAINSKGYAEEISLSWFNSMFVARYLGHSSERARQGFEQVWSMLRPKLSGRSACAPRIWRT